MIVERVERLSPCAAHTNEPGAPKEPKLMGYGRLGELDQCRQIADAAFAVTQRVDQTHAGRIAEQPEDVGHRLHGPGRQQALLHRGEDGRITDVGGLARLGGR